MKPRFWRPLSSTFWEDPPMGMGKSDPETWNFSPCSITNYLCCCICEGSPTGAHSVAEEQTRSRHKQSSVLASLAGGLTCCKAGSRQALRDDPHREAGAGGGAGREEAQPPPPPPRSSAALEPVPCPSACPAWSASQLPHLPPPLGYMSKNWFVQLACKLLRDCFPETSRF